MKWNTQPNQNAWNMLIDYCCLHPVSPCDIDSQGSAASQLNSWQAVTPLPSSSLSSLLPHLFLDTTSHPLSPPPSASLPLLNSSSPPAPTRPLSTTSLSSLLFSSVYPSPPASPPLLSLCWVVFCVVVCGGLLCVVWVGCLWGGGSCFSVCLCVCVGGVSYSSVCVCVCVSIKVSGGVGPWP